MHTNKPYRLIKRHLSERKAAGRALKRNDRLRFMQIQPLPNQAFPPLPPSTASSSLRYSLSRTHTHSYTHARRNVRLLLLPQLGCLYFTFLPLRVLFRFHTIFFLLFIYILRRLFISFSFVYFSTARLISLNAKHGSRMDQRFPLSRFLSAFYFSTLHPFLRGSPSDASVSLEIRSKGAKRKHTSECTLHRAAVNLELTRVENGAAKLSVYLLLVLNPCEHLGCREDVVSSCNTQVTPEVPLINPTYILFETTYILFGYSKR